MTIEEELMHLREQLAQGEELIQQQQGLLSEQNALDPAIARATEYSCRANQKHARTPLQAALCGLPSFASADLSSYTVS